MTADSFAASYRLWPVLMTTRAALAIALALAATWLWLSGVSHQLLALGCALYAVQAIQARWFSTIPRSRSELDMQWLRNVSLDVLVYASLQVLQFAGLNYSPLFLLPVLTAAIFGAGLLHLATAAGVSLLLLGEAWWSATALGQDTTPRLLQAGLYGFGFFGLAILAHAMALRLAAEEALARASDALAKMQIQVNQRVIDALDDGVLVVDANGVVRSINPAAERMLSAASVSAPRVVPFMLAGDASLLPLASLVANSMLSGEQTQAFALNVPGLQALQLVAQTRLVRLDEQAENLVCVVYLEDSRAIEARVRTEKLAAMGRMSAAVAHEIRNPLAAISQANQLLAESATGAQEQRLSKIVRDNALRLGRIVDEVLSVSHVQGGESHEHARVELGMALRSICNDWLSVSGYGQRFAFADLPAMWVRFDADHLRQVVVNLLDNASRFASADQSSIRVDVRSVPDGQRCVVSVWNDGAAIDPGVQAHLFEPFFSSQSRSSGLGLFICRELCERHAATIVYSRAWRGEKIGNCFEISCATAVTGRKVQTETEASNWDQHESTH